MALLTDPNLRSLVHLQDTASTARVLNLPAIWKKHGNEPEYLEQPFFCNQVLNRCFVIKHRLRRNEIDLFADQRTAATKILVPMDHTNLKIGGRYLFVGQRGYDRLLESLLGDGTTDRAHDRGLLQLLDATPSLDPFLLREQLRRHGFHPARCYFDISDADMARMFAFVEAEIAPLVNIAFNGDPAFAAQTAKFVAAILSSEWTGELDPLRQTLRLGEQEYQEGMFCWKGFLYYKWTLREVLPGIRRVWDDLSTLQPKGHIDRECAEYLERAKLALRRAINTNLDAVKSTIQVYDRAYANLTRNSRPMAFREFLLEAPLLFSELGHRLSTLNHIHKFWEFRVTSDATVPMTLDEFIGLLVEFEAGLNTTNIPSAGEAARERALSEMRSGNAA